MELIVAKPTVEASSTTLAETEGFFYLSFNHLKIPNHYFLLVSIVFY